MDRVVGLFAEWGEDFGPPVDGTQASRDYRADAELLALEGRSSISSPR